MDQIIASTDAYLAIPTDKLGVEYVVAAYQQWNAGGSQVAVVATEDDTRVTIAPSAYVTPGPDLPSGARTGVPFTITLDRLETFQIHNTNESSLELGDLSGTIVTATKPIAVYGGNVCTMTWSAAADHIVEQMPPVTALGTRFATVPLEDRLYVEAGDIFRVVAAEDDTEVSGNRGRFSVSRN